MAVLSPKQRGSDDVLSILTFNTGLLRVSVLDTRLAEPTPFLEERFRALGPAILECDADVVALQEIYFTSHRDTLTRRLGSAYPHHARHDRCRWPSLGNGLLIYSKTPLDDVEYLRFSEVDLQERVFVGKGAVLATTSVPGLGRVALANLHTTAGGFVETDSDRANRWRSSNLRQAISRLRARDADVRFLVGDFNAGPQASAVNYEELADAGWIDGAIGSPAADGVTWDPQNPLNSSGPHSHCPAQRIDHVFVDRSAATVPTTRARVVLTETRVDTPAGFVSLSDHYGLLAEVVPATESPPRQGHR